jgi:glyoxylase-like metal-dependent hydrolase (beta-lactamase superfamily II)
LDNADGHVLTHLPTDHAGGLRQFPDNEIVARGEVTRAGSWSLCQVLLRRFPRAAGEQEQERG